MVIRCRSGWRRQHLVGLTGQEFRITLVCFGYCLICKKSRHVSENFQVKSYYRFRKNSATSKPSIIKIELTTPMDRFSIIKKAKQLKSKGENFNRIYVNFDLSLSQRNLRKQLPEECKSKNKYRLQKNLCNHANFRKIFKI